MFTIKKKGGGVDKNYTQKNTNVWPGADFLKLKNKSVFKSPNFHNI